MEPPIDPIGQLMKSQVAFAAAVALGLPLSLLILAWRPAWLDASARAVDEARTKTVLWGAALVVLGWIAVLFALSARVLHPVAWCVACAMLANAYAGFSVGALAQGRSMLRREAGASPIVWGWLARAGAFAVPVVGVVVGAYFVALASGTPFVAWLASRKSTAAPSDGADTAR
ncbi:MAG: hypothetical protein K8T90_08255 [Planctomycetes bacterium]|nr:hypothetical protein [Planctomycetota bacterium]